MPENVYFEGDPETDSARRRLERLLSESKPRPRKRWFAAAFAGLAAWYLWPRRRSERDGPRRSHD